MPQADGEPNFFLLAAVALWVITIKMYAKHHENILGFSRQGELYNGQKWD